MSFDDVLPAGVYRVVANADGITHVTSGFDFLLVGNPVPVPLLPPIASGALVVMVGALGVSRLRRR